MRLALKLAGGEADDLQAMRGQLPALAAVAFEGLWRGVDASAVEFDDDVRAGPVGVDLPAVEVDVLLGKGEGVVAAEAGEGAFELGAGEGRFVVEELQRAGELLDAAASVRPLDDGLRCVEVEQPAADALFEGVLELVRGQDFGEVEEGAADGGDPEAAAGGDLVGVQGPDAVDLHEGEGLAAASGRGDLDPRPGGPGDLPEGGGGAMAQAGLRADGEQGGVAAADRGQRRVADGVDPRKDAVKLSRSDAVVDDAGRQPELEELGAADRSALTNGQVREGWQC